jgi:hypothetical protein
MGVRHRLLDVSARLAAEHTAPPIAPERRRFDVGVGAGDRTRTGDPYLGKVYL